MIQKTISSLLILAVFTTTAFAGTRKISSSTQEFNLELKKIRDGGDVDFETLIQKAIGAGWKFEDDAYFKGFKKVTGPHDDQLPGALADVNLLVKVKEMKNVGYQFTFITTTDAMAKEGKFYETRSVRITSIETDLANRMHWEETVNSLATATVIAVEKAHAKDKQDKIDKARATVTCIVARWSAAAVLGGGLFIYMNRLGVTPGNRVGNVGIAALFGVTVGLFAFILADSICSGAPAPSM